jgi:hypothetical protein
MARLRLLLIVALILASACWSSDEVARTSEPAGRLDAVVVERNGGATTSFGYEVYVVPRGPPPYTGTLVADFYGAVRNENAYGVNARWTAGHQLRIEYLRAQSATLRHEETTIAGTSIRISLRDSVRDPSAPMGGMLYNRQGRPYDALVP